MKYNAILASLGASLAVVNAGSITSYVNDGIVGPCNKTLVAGTNYVSVNPSALPLVCGFTITIRFNQKTATGVILDSCTDCNGEDIKVSKYMFKALTGHSYGSENITWNS